MMKDIPHVVFNAATDKNLGFEIVPLGSIAQKRTQKGHNPEKPHQLKFYNLIFFTEGEGRHFIDFNWYKVKKNSLVYLTKEQVNAFEFKAGLEGFCLIFTEEYFVDCFSKLTEDFVFRLFNPELFSPILEIPRGSDFEIYFKLLQEEYENENNFHQKNIINSLFTILISKAENIKQNQTFHIKDTTKIRLFKKFSSLIEEKYAISRSATFYASELHITYKHLNSVCKELVSKTAKSVISDFIVLQAKREMINSAIKSTELAYKLGFDDPTNFTKYFKKNTGLTPNSFLKSVLKG